DLVDVLRVRIFLDRRVDEEDDRHVLRLARLQRLLGEAEALDFLEILADLVGADVEHRLAGQRLRAEVLRAVEDLRLRARLDADRGPLGLEAPRQAGMDVGVEANADLARYRPRRAFGALRRAVEPRIFTEHPI